MALWVVRTGKLNEYEGKFLDKNNPRIYLTWDQLPDDLSDLEGLKTFLREKEYEQKDHPDIRVGAIPGYAGQIQAFANKMQVGDWVACPSKRGVIHIAKIMGDFERDPKAEQPFCYFRRVEWIALDIPRTNFDQDILYSLGGASTIFQVQKNDAENRVREMAKNGWRATEIKTGKYPEVPDNSVDPDSAEDLEEIATDQITRTIYAKFKGHTLERLIEAILQAKGFKTYRSPKGPDQGIDILASTGELGFDDPKICVQVKSQDSQLERSVVDGLRGVMAKVGATKGLIVCWGGFKNSLDKDKSEAFFNVRFWDQNDLIEQFLACYDKLDEEIQSMVPLKKIWVMAQAD